MGTEVYKVGSFRSKTQHGDPVKTRIYLGWESNTIFIERYLYGEESDGWKSVKQFKGKHLCINEFHVRVESFAIIAHIVSKHLDKFKDG